MAWYKAVLLATLPRDIWARYGSVRFFTGYGSVRFTFFQNFFSFGLWFGSFPLSSGSLPISKSNDVLSNDIRVHRLYSSACLSVCSLQHAVYY